MFGELVGVVSRNFVKRIYSITQQLSQLLNVDLEHQSENVLGRSCRSIQPYEHHL